MLIIQLITDYNVQVSFNDQLLSEYPVTVNRDFSSPEEAIEYLIRNLPFDLENKGPVLVIVPEKESKPATEFLFAGQILDGKTGESLPYSHILTGKQGMISDGNGSFVFRSSSDSLQDFKISYLGYYVLDTLLSPGANQKINLRASVIGLKEVVIEGDIVEYTTQIGDKAGMIRLNHKVAQRLPGNGDNSVFNFLRLQPGILAAGEQSSDVIIWGGYAGHSIVLFDGFTIFGLKNFNDNISAVNPYMAKDIMVMKGGYSANYGDRVGGIVNISGIDGNINKPSFNFNINNMTLNGKASIPIKNQSSLVFAFRRTYFNLYDPEDINLFRNTGRNPAVADINVYPVYSFKDMNIKYSGSSKKGDTYYLSLFRGKDNFNYTLDQDRTGVSIEQEAEEKNNQLGGTAHWSRTWERGLQSNISLSYSGLQRDLTTVQEIKRILNGEIVTHINESLTNKINEISGKNTYAFIAFPGHRLEGGWGMVYNKTLLKEDSLENTISQTINDVYRLNIFIQDKIYLLSNHVILIPGIRVDFPLHLLKAYIQPRFSLSIPINSNWKINGAWGIYNQFISETSVLDDFGNYRYFWAICNNQDVPVLSSVHYVGGLTYKDRNITFSLETFYKKTDGITRYINLVREDFKTVFSGDSKAYGADVYIKGKFRKHEGWISYTLSKTLEYFPYFVTGDYREALHDQRHEIKSAIILNFDPFFVALNYVYGSGFPDRHYYQNIREEERIPYSRFDAGVIYRYGYKGFNLEAGFSILNILNTENLKYSNLIRVPSNQINTIKIYAEAIPFTPTIYLNVFF